MCVSWTKKRLIRTTTSNVDDEDEEDTWKPKDRRRSTFDMFNDFDNQPSL